MDNENKKAPTSANDTLRHERQGVSHRQGGFDMDKLRRDLEDSKKLHDEARKKKNQAAQTERIRHAENHSTDALRQESLVNNRERAQASAQHTAKTSASSGKEHKKEALSKERTAAAWAATVRTAKKLQQKKKTRKPLRERRGCGCLFYLFLLALVVCVAFAALWMVRAHNAATPIDQIPETDRAAVAMEREKQNVYLLLAGTDQRADEASRSDTIMYAALRPVDRKIEMVSIPRDSLVEIPDYGEGKVNSALAYGGMSLLADTVENLVDNPVDHTVLINFSSFESIIDAMGGITINVEQDMYLPEEGIDLKAGEQKLDGHDALAYVRWRGDGTGDIGRMERQHIFMQAMSEKVRHLTPWRAVMTMWTVSHEIETDMSTLDLLKLAWDFIGMSGDALEVQNFTYETPYIDGVSYVQLDEQSVNETLQLMKYGTIIDSNGTDDSTSDSEYGGYY